METRNDILDELRNWGSPLADMPRTMPYAVPEGYFDSFSMQLFAAAGQHDGTMPLSKKMPFDLPQGYFDTLPTQVLALAAEEPSLTLPAAMPYAVPQGYFDQLPGQILQAVHQQGKQQPTLIPLGRKIGRSLRWAAAAILLSAIGIGSYRMLSPSPAFDANNELTRVPASELTAYVEQNIDEFDADMLANTVASADNNIQSLSDEDIIDYLDETGWNTTVTN